MKKTTKISRIVLPIIAVVVAVVIFFIYQFISNNDAGPTYDIKPDAVYYGEQKIDAKPNEVEWLNYWAIKDSSNVYYRGKLQKWADRATFKFLGDRYYYDKNGMYYANSTLPDLEPVAGIYDKDSFKFIAEDYCKDKNNLYKLNTSFFNGGGNPLEKIKISGLDIASFDKIGSFWRTKWFKDKNKVYFLSSSGLEPCPEIDVNSFQELTHQVYKDKNQVYYSTQDLSSDGKSSTIRAGYTVLEGADAPSFKMKDLTHFEDKNQEWVIE